ncbi:alpha/beta fold hydrolase [Ornithinimicrobium sufpigmenti]|uniref:alpha/beta fold hydrolase n=1 Tax=Ornithinimicrobium sufpigmenti TaxID=2508882 RepID=UPI001EDCD1BE|nr:MULTISPECIES: alpha/beta fold hydrolase [unclassified Ornithinimicrobium]
MGQVHSYSHDGLTFEVLDGGPPGGETVVLLHGFPEDATAYDQVAPLLHGHGLRTLAPHQRGYSRGARPRRASAYRVGTLVDDVVALLDAAGVRRAHVVGHDWGGAIAWALAQRRPDRVASLVVLSTPHPRALRWAAARSDQVWRSRYMLAFQLPHLAELLLVRMVQGEGMVRRGVPVEHQRRYAARLRRPTDLRGPVNWYRAPLRPRLPGSRWHHLEAGDSGLPQAPVRVPTTFVWGRHDVYLGRTAAERTAAYVDADYRFVELDADHWLPEREPEAVAHEIVARVGETVSR